MHLRLGCLKVTIHHTYTRGKTIYYQRSVPLALRDRYPSKTIKIKLGAISPPEVLRKVTALDNKYEAEFSSLLTSPESSPASLRVHAERLLDQHGLTPGLDNHEEVLWSFFDEVVEPKRRAYAGQDMDLYLDAPLDAYLTPVETLAMGQVSRPVAHTLSYVFEVYLSVHPKAKREKFVLFQTRIFSSLIDTLGDVPVESLKRADVRRHIDRLSAKGLKTGTIQRHLGALGSIFKAYYLEQGLATVNPFGSILLAGAGEDAKKAKPYSLDELSLLASECLAKADPLRLALLILMETGARLAEVIGMRRSDLVLDHEIPHLMIQPHPWRSLKNVGSKRNVPLVGHALWAAQRLLEVTPPDAQHPFPQYTSLTSCKAGSASAALLGWIRSRVEGHTVKDLRHTVADRLRAVECPRDIHFSITGHSESAVGDSYGDGHNLHTKIRWLKKIALHMPEEC